MGIINQPTGDIKTKRCTTLAVHAQVCVQIVVFSFLSEFIQDFYSITEIILLINFSRVTMMICIPQSTNDVNTQRKLFVALFPSFLVQRLTHSSV